MVYIAHQRNPFKSMNYIWRRYDYIYYKTGPVVQEEKIFMNVPLQFCYYLSMYKGVAFPFEQT